MQRRRLTLVLKQEDRELLSSEMSKFRGQMYNYDYMATTFPTLYKHVITLFYLDMT